MINNLAAYSLLIGGLAFLSYIGLEYLKEKSAKSAGKNLLSYL